MSGCAVLHQLGIGRLSMDYGSFVVKDSTNDRVSSVQYMEIENLTDKVISDYYLRISVYYDNYAIFSTEPVNLELPPKSKVMVDVPIEFYYSYLLSKKLDLRKSVLKGSEHFSFEINPILSNKQSTGSLFSYRNSGTDISIKPSKIDIKFPNNKVQKFNIFYILPPKDKKRFDREKRRERNKFINDTIF
jgi:hypothetical protein